MRLSYGAPNEDCEVRDHIIAGGKLQIDKFKTVVNEGNVQEPTVRKAVLVPNKYDPRRANVAIYNGAKAEKVAVDVEKFLKPGDNFRVVAPRDFFGEPVFKGLSRGPGGVARQGRLRGLGDPQGVTWFTG